MEIPSPIKSDQLPPKLPPATNTKSNFFDDTQLIDHILKKEDRRKNSVNEDVLKIIHRMHQKNYKAKEIAELTGLTKSTVYKYIDRMDKEKVDPKDMSVLIKKRGRKRNENTELCEKITKVMASNENATLKAIKDELKKENYEISISYLSKTISRMGLRGKENTSHDISRSKLLDNSQLSQFSQIAKGNEEPMSISVIRNTEPPKMDVNNVVVRPSVSTMNTMPDTDIHK